MVPPLAVEVKDSIFDPDSNDRAVPVRREAGKRPLYRVFLYLDGPDLPFVDWAKYQLHSSFSEPVRTVSRGLVNPRCKLEIWTWGLFRVNVTVVDRNGNSYSLHHDLHYDSEFERENVKFTAA
jgi:transcription initiation factor IIF auxiliary subunit